MALIPADIKDILILIIPFISGFPLAIWRRRKDRPMTAPQYMSTRHPNTSMKIRKPLLQRTWFIILLILLIMAYVLSEILTPGALTKFSVYKICMGVGAFFFILIHSTVSRAFEALAAMKMADLDLLGRDPTRSLGILFKEVPPGEQE